MQPFTVIGSLAKQKFPLVVDAPHSWRCWPSTQPTRATSAELLTSWDAFVDELWALALQQRAPLLSANFHRAYIDANRARDDIDPGLLREPLPFALAPTQKSERGCGLIRRDILPGVPLYAQTLAAMDVLHRLTELYDPYHQAMEFLVARTHQRFGMSLMLDCHSMKSVGNAMNDDCGRQRPDMVVSDMDGVTSHPAISQWIAELLRENGYRVQVNDPYKGGELIRRNGFPQTRKFAVQIEINRALYMNERTHAKSSHFTRLVQDLTAFVDSLALNLMERILGLPA
ncbi:MAG: N-formylglutamate amidohydrolase [Pseudomonadota bacterium]